MGASAGDGSAGGDAPPARAGANAGSGGFGAGAGSAGAGAARPVGVTSSGAGTCSSGGLAGGEPGPPCGSAAGGGSVAGTGSVGGTEPSSTGTGSAGGSVTPGSGAGSGAGGADSPPVGSPEGGSGTGSLGAGSTGSPDGTGTGSAVGAGAGSCGRPWSTGGGSCGTVSPPTAGVPPLSGADASPTSGAGATSPVVVVSGPAGSVTDASSIVAGEVEDGSTGGTPVKSGDEAAAKLAWARNAHAATVTSAIHDRVAQIRRGQVSVRTSGTSSDSKNTQPRGAPGEPGTWAQTTSEDVPCQLPTRPDGQGNSPGSRSERERHLAQDASTWHWRHELCGGPGVLGDDRERAIDLLLARTAHRASPALIGTCASPCPDRYFVVEPNALDLPPVEIDRDDGGKPVQDTYPRHLPPLLQLD